MDGCVSEGGLVGCGDVGKAVWTRTDVVRFRVQ